jgi:hypothetical protein
MRMSHHRRVLQEKKRCTIKGKNKYCVNLEREGCLKAKEILATPPSVAPKRTSQLK